VLNGTLYDFPGIDSAGGQCAFKQVLHGDNLILGSEKHNLEGLFFEVSHRVAEVAGDLLRRVHKFFVQNLLLEELLSQLLHKLDYKDMGRADSVNLL